MKGDVIIMKKINLKGINKEAITGILILLFALVNATLQMFGINVIPIENEEITNIVSTVFLILTALYNTWKNRNLTTASQVAQTITDALKSGELLESEVRKVIEKTKK